MKFTVSASLKCCEFCVNNFMDDAVIFAALVILRKGEAPTGEKKKKKKIT